VDSRRPTSSQIFALFNSCWPSSNSRPSCSRPRHGQLEVLNLLVAYKTNKCCQHSRHSNRRQPLPSSNRGSCTTLSTSSRLVKAQARTPSWATSYNRPNSRLRTPNLKMPSNFNNMGSGSKRLGALEPSVVRSLGWEALEASNRARAMQRATLVFCMQQDQQARQMQIK
jgi:hypothetical protein